MGLEYTPEPEMKLVKKVFTERVGTGIEGLDKSLNGGLFKGSVTMVAGASGTGKTTTALQFIVEGEAHWNRAGLGRYCEKVDDDGGYKNLD